MKTQNIKREMYKEFKKELCKYAAHNEVNDEMLCCISKLVSIHRKTDRFVEYMIDNHREHFIAIINGNYENISVIKEVSESIYNICGTQTNHRETSDADEKIRRKTDFLKGIYKVLHKRNEEVLNELEIQIEVCEDMGKGLPESKIKEFILSCNNELQIEIRVRDFKFS